MICLHQGFEFSVNDAENFVRPINTWNYEEIQDIAYQTFLYMNYNPDDPDFYNDGDIVRFPLK